jgi:hypothetical protein
MAFAESQRRAEDSAPRELSTQAEKALQSPDGARASGALDPDERARKVYGLLQASESDRLPGVRSHAANARDSEEIRQMPNTEAQAERQRWLEWQAANRW